MVAFIKNSFLGLLILCSVSSCYNIDRLDPIDSDLGSDKTRVLAHRGAGLNSTLFRENTLAGVKYGLQQVDGVEIDIAISKDGGLWLSHDSEVMEYEKGFIKVTDNEIAALKDENGEAYYDNLEAILSYISSHAATKYVSLDVKYPKEIISFNTFQAAAKKLGELTKKYDLENRISVQSGFFYFLKKVNEENAAIETYFMSYGNFEKGISKAYKNQLTGLSFDHDRVDEISQADVDLAHSLGVKVLIYSVESDNLAEVYGYGIDFMETDEMDFYEFIDR